MSGYFVGREVQLAELRDTTARTAQGPAQLVLLEGKAGIGKSAMVRRWLADPVFRPFTVLQALCDNSEQDWPFAMINQLMSRAPRSALFEFPALAAGPAPDSAPEEVAAQFVAFLEHLVRTAPVALIVDDAQYADEESLAVLTAVLARPTGRRVLTALITCGIPGQDAADFAGLDELMSTRSPACHMVLPGLSGREVQDLAKRLTGRPMTARTADRIRHHTGGNPLYLETLLKEVPPALLADEQQAFPTPSSMVSVVRRQLAALPADSRRLVEAAAIVEWPTALTKVAEIARVPDLTAAAPAAAAGFLRQRPGDEACVTVAYAVQRSAIEAAISPVRRRALHQTAAQVLEPAQSWRHKVAASNGPNAELAAELESEAHQHLRSGDVDRAATLLLWASEVAATRTDHEWLLLAAAAQLMWNERYARVGSLLPRVHDCAPHPLRDLVLGSWAMRRSATGEAVALLNQARRGAEARSGQQWIAGMAGLHLSFLHLLRGQGPKAVKAAQRVLALKGLEASLSTRAKVQLALAGGLVNGPAASGRHVSMYAVSEPSEGGETRAAADLLVARGLSRSACGELTQGAADLTAALRSAGGRPMLAEVARIQLAADQYLLGAWDDMTLSVERMLASAESARTSWPQALAYSVASWVPAARGDGERAEELIHRSEERSTAMSEALPRVLLSIGRALACQAQEDHAAMLAAVEPLRRSDVQGHARWHELHWRPLHVEALINTGRHDAAGQAISRLRRLATRMPCMRIVTAWLMGQLAEALGDMPAAGEHYKRGLAMPASPDDPPLHRARLEHAHGNLLATVQDRHGAETWLRKAAHGFGALGAAPFADRCERDLTALIRDHAEIPQTGAMLQEVLQRLTDREREIALLTARGLTNKEIAAELCISTKTIEYHLNRVYMKLELTSRHQLRSLISRTLPA